MSFCFIDALCTIVKTMPIATAAHHIEKLWLGRNLKMTAPAIKPSIKNKGGMRRLGIRMASLSAETDPYAHPTCPHWHAPSPRPTPSPEQYSEQKSEIDPAGSVQPHTSFAQMISSVSLAISNRVFPASHESNRRPARL